jgi:urease accessory protein
VTASAVAPPPAGHAHGLLALTLRPDAGGRTRLTSRRHRFPLRTTVAFHLDPADPRTAFVIVQNPTGGIFPGDVLSVRISAEAGARVHVTGQSATKLAPGDAPSPGTQHTRVEVGPGAFVELWPDTLIPHPRARHRQATTVELAHGGVFVAGEVLAPGRAGERFAYDRIDLRTSVSRDGDELCIDALRLEPSRWPGGDAGILGDRGWLATLFVAAPEHDVGALARELDGALERDDDVLAAAAPLPGDCGVGVRILGHGGPATTRALRRAWALTRERLLGLALPPRRKA